MDQIMREVIARAERIAVVKVSRTDDADIPTYNRTFTDEGLFRQYLALIGAKPNREILSIASKCNCGALAKVAVRFAFRGEPVLFCEPHGNQDLTAYIAHLRKTRPTRR